MSYNCTDRTNKIKNKEIMNSIIQIINCGNISKIKVNEIRGHCDNIDCVRNIRYKANLNICKNCKRKICGDCTNSRNNKCVVCKCKRMGRNKCKRCGDVIRYLMCWSCGDLLKLCTFGCKYNIKTTNFPPSFGLLCENCC